MCYKKRAIATVIVFCGLAVGPSYAATCFGMEVTVDLRIEGQFPTNGSDVIRGTNGFDVIEAGGGDDVICGLGGDDMINGGDGNDRIRGQAGNDIIDGGFGDDMIWGNAGDDVLSGGFGSDLVSGNAGDDVIGGGPGTDMVFGGSGNDSLYALFGGNVLNEVPVGFEDESDENMLFGGAGDDDLFGSLTADTLVGNGGDDFLYGRGAVDDLRGGGGNDVLCGGSAEEGPIFELPIPGETIPEEPVMEDEFIVLDENDTLDGGRGDTDICVDGVADDSCESEIIDSLLSSPRFNLDACTGDFF